MEALHIQPLPPGVPHPAMLPVAELLDQCKVEFTRRSGPGGQHRNKVQTAVVLRHLPTGVQGEASERRSQAENRTVACFRLRLKLAVEIRSAASSGPSPLWQRRCQSGRISVSEEHADFPGLLAEALDVIAGVRGDLATAAEALGCSPSQLLKLLKRHPPALTLVNQWREQMELRALK